MHSMTSSWPSTWRPRRSTLKMPATWGPTRAREFGRTFIDWVCLRRIERASPLARAVGQTLNPHGLRVHPTKLLCEEENHHFPTRAGVDGFPQILVQRERGPRRTLLPE